MPAGHFPGQPPGPARPGAAAEFRSEDELALGGIAVGVVGVLAAALLAVAPRLSGGVAKDIVGRWSGQYGDQFLLVDGKTVRMYYPSREGRVQGTLDNDVIQGWWVESTGIEPGGRADFHIVRGGAQLKFDGAWSSGTDQPSHAWGLIRIDGTIPESARAKPEDPSIFPAPPRTGIDSGGSCPQSDGDRRTEPQTSFKQSGLIALVGMRAPAQTLWWTRRLLLQWRQVTVGAGQ